MDDFYLAYYYFTSPVQYRPGRKTSILAAAAAAAGSLPYFVPSAWVRADAGGLWHSRAQGPDAHAAASRIAPLPPLAEQGEQPITGLPFSSSMHAGHK